ncbi:2597_t:CDS:1 [Paraglomus occultum]|uniref:2597_t:CDS:1 n=1 Tax=Paraglomus occultum TaxID=144539 RepID=A0A9N9CSA8_9GLOM|nr:2597_t:CDS:1 [Paraglomus occultum]
MSRQKVSFILVALLLGLFTLVAVTFNQGFFKQALTTDVKICKSQQTWLFLSQSRFQHDDSVFNCLNMAAQNRYIIVLKDDATPEDLEKFEAHIINSGGKIVHRYTEVLKGFAVSMPEDVVMTMKDDPSVDSIELDQPGKMLSIRQ